MRYVLAFFFVLLFALPAQGASVADGPTAKKPSNADVRRIPVHREVLNLKTSADARKAGPQPARGVASETTNK